MQIDEYMTAEEPRLMDASLEKTVLGAILRDPDRLDEVLTSLTPEDFALDAHRRIALAMAAIGAEKLDTITLMNELKRIGELEVVGGASYVISLDEGVPRRANIAEYLRLIRDKAICRGLVAVSEALQGRAYANDTPASEIASWAVSAIETAIGTERHSIEVWDAVGLSEDAEFRLIDHPEDAPAIPTGIRTLDERTGGGIRRGELWVVGASPSRGKTTFARQTVLTAVSAGIPVYVHSGEMSKESWFDVTACLMEDLQPWRTREPKFLNFTEREKLRNGLRALGKMPLYISDAGGIHIDRLLWHAARQVRQNKIQLFAVDYAQIVTASGRDERQKVTAVAQRMRMFAKENNVATLLLSQSPRPEGRNINARPTMFSLKETGALEEAAHTVILPYRPVNQETGEFTGEDELIIGKNRWGAIGSVPVFLDGKYLRFQER